MDLIYFMIFGSLFGCIKQNVKIYITLINSNYL